VSPDSLRVVIEPGTPLASITDAEIDELLRRAALPPLLAALALATGETWLLRDDLRPDPRRATEPQGGLDAEQRAAARRLAAEGLRCLRDQHPSGDRAPAGPNSADRGQLAAMLAFTIGEPVEGDYVEMLLEELALDDPDPRAPCWRVDEIDPDRTVRAVVIGAGMSGVVAAHRLLQAGVDCTVVEKNTGPGGTWFENRYPGCRVDVPNHLYSYSFRQRLDWRDQFTPQSDLLGYFEECAEALGVAACTRFGTEVVAAAWDDIDCRWTVTTRDRSGKVEVFHAEILVSAVGQLNRPRVPDIAGRDRFRGPQFHSAAWDHSVDLRGQRVAVIGTAASAIQIIPTIAASVAHLDVYQRTPNWFTPTPGYHDPTPASMQWLFKHVPTFAAWYRFWLFFRLAEGTLAAARVDNSWPGDGSSVSALNEQLRTMLAAYLEQQFADRPDLLEIVMPHYPPLAKRMLLDNGSWAGALKRDNVELVTDPITEITERGIRTGSGRERPADVIVYATGFRASEFLMPMRMSGRGGRDLHEYWAGAPSAYLGITMSGFPNLFCMYGPNTNLVANGSIIFFAECQANYIVDAVRTLLTRRATSLECRPEVDAEYRDRVARGNAAMAWGASDVNSWYKNADGQVTQNWPFTMLEYWQWTHRLDPGDYEFVDVS